MPNHYSLITLASFFAFVFGLMQVAQAEVMTFDDLHPVEEVTEIESSRQVKRIKKPQVQAQTQNYQDNQDDYEFAPSPSKYNSEQIDVSGSYFDSTIRRPKNFNYRPQKRANKAVRRIVRKKRRPSYIARVKKARQRLEKRNEILMKKKIEQVRIQNEKRMTQLIHQSFQQTLHNF